MKKFLLFALKLVLTGLCLWWAFHEFKWQESILARPSEIGWGWFIPGILLGGVSVFLTGLRLWLLLAAQNIHISIWRSFELTLIGNLFNMAAVGGIGGDAAKIFLLIRDHPERKLAVTMTVMFDHLVGFLAMAMAFFGFAAWQFDGIESQSVETTGIIRFSWAFFIGGVVLIASMFLVAYPPINERIHARRGHFKAAILRQAPGIFDVYRKKWKHALLSLVIAVVLLPFFYATFWCGARAAGSDVTVGPFMVSMTMVDMLSALPLSVAGLGIREASLQVLMEDLSGMKPDVAVAASLIGFICSQLFWAVVGGLMFLRPKDRANVHEIEEVTADE